MNYNWFAKHPPGNIVVLPFESQDIRDGFLTERLRRDFYLSLISKNYPTAPLPEVDQQLISLSQQSGKKLTTDEIKRLNSQLGTRLLAVGELSEISRLYLLIYSQVSARGRFWLLDSNTGEKVFYNEVTAINKRFSPATGLLGLGMSGIDTLSHQRGSQVVATVRALGEHAVEPLPDYPLSSNSNERIEKINVNVDSQELKIGDIIEVEAWGPPGRKAWFDIGLAAKFVPLQEQVPGYYRGRHVITRGESVEYGLVRVAMSTADGMETFGAVKFDLPLRIDAEPPPPPLVAEFRTTRNSLILKFSLNPKPADLKEVIIYRAIDSRGTEDNFKLIGKLKEGDIFVDKDITPATTYVYTAVAIDRIGNTSGSGKPLKINLPSKGPTLLRGTYNRPLVLMRYASPFFIDGPIVVENTASVLIEPGVKIYLSPKGGFFLNGGELKAMGTNTEKIYFQPTESQWAGINTTSNRQNYINIVNAEIESAVIGLELNNSNTSLRQVKFKRCATALKLGNSVSCWLYQCEFYKNEVALINTAEKVSLHRCDFIKNDYNIIAPETKQELLPERKIYSFSAFLSGSRLVLTRSP